MLKYLLFMWKETGGNNKKKEANIHFLFCSEERNRTADLGVMNPTL